jgi:hypothetical protein
MWDMKSDVEELREMVHQQKEWCVEIGRGNPRVVNCGRGFGG